MGAVMRNTLMGAVGALAVLVLPAIGSAASGPYMWVESSSPLPNVSPSNPNVENLNFEGSTTQREVTIGCMLDAPCDGGFDFNFYGETFGKMRVGTKGYVTFGATDTAASNPNALHAATGPSRLIAAWWGNHFCDPKAGVKHQVLGTAPNREHRVEWNCTAASSNGGITGTTFRARVTLFENSSVIQLHYGNLTFDGGAGWTAPVRVGIKSTAGSSVAYSNALPECSDGACGHSNFPSGHVIQYGTWVHDATHLNLPDLFARVGNVNATMDLSSGQPVVKVNVAGEIRNLTDIDITDYTYRAYLSPVKASYSVGDYLIGESSGNDLGPLGDLPLSFQDVAMNLPGDPPLNGTYYACIGAVTLKPEVSKANNWNCNPVPVILGPDLTGSVATPNGKVRPMEVFDVQLKFRNVGNLPAMASPTDPIEFTIWAINYDDHDDIFELLNAGATKWSGTPQYGPAETFKGKITTTIHPGQEISQTVRAKFPNTPTGGATQFIIGMKIGSSWDFDGVRYTDANPLNNEVKSEPSSDSTKLLEYLAPSYNPTPGEFHFEMPLGCIFGEPAWGSYEVCNLDGTTEAIGFLPAITFPGGGGEGPLSPEAGFSASFFPQCKKITREETSPGRFEIKERDNPSLCASGSTCSWMVCWPDCDPYSSLENNGCDDGLACKQNYYHLEAYGEVMYSCLPYLEKKACHTYEFHGIVPSHEQEPNPDVNDPSAEWYTSFPDLHGMMPTAVPNYLGSPYITDLFLSWMEDPEVIECYVPKADLVANSMPMAPIEVVAGEQFVVERVIFNTGTLDSEFEYTYHFSTVPELSRHQPKVPVVASRDGVGSAQIPRMVLNQDRTTSTGVNRRHDTLVMPSQTPPGLYYFGFVVDPQNKIAEISKTNNTYVHNRQIRVRPPSLQIETERLPNATVGVRYNYSLWASGGTGAYRWEKGEGFPAWLDLDPATGHLSGIPTDDRDYMFQVTVRSGNVSATRTLLLRVLAPEGMLWIPQHVLPLAIVNEPYGPVELKANGGKPPYEWTFKSIDEATPLPVGFCDRAPEGIIDSCSRGATGVLDPVPPHLTAGFRSFYVGVRDARGAEAWAELRLQIAGTKELVIETRSMNPGLVGDGYSTTLTAEGGSGADFTWVIENLPRGLEVRNDAGRAFIEGTPLEWGVFMVQATVLDPSGLTATKSFALEISNRDLTLTRNHLGEFERGKQVDERLDIVGLSMTETVSIRLLQGRLPSGLELTSDHWIRGVISSAAEPGTYSVVLELRSDSGRLTPAALSIRVKPPAAPAPKEEPTGCSASAGGSSPSGALPLGLALLGLIGWTRGSRREALDTE